ncbi:MAG: porin [Verrucomicrobia bacterium]|jgi:phosphate-selective porin OprO/OprP|nr:porin [Verrucomicrobiota bacterium]
MNFRNIVLAAITGFFLIGSVALANSNDALLNLLIRKGVITEAEAAEVAAELSAASEGAKARPELRAESEEDDATRETEVIKRVKFDAKGKDTVELRFSGRMHFQYDHLSSDYTGTKDTANHFYFRRLFLGVEADLDNGIYAKSVLNFADDRFAIDKAFFGYTFNEVFDIQLGYQKVPFGFEETSSSARIPTIERSAANRFLANDIDFSARHAGIHSSGRLGAGFSYAVAFVNGAQGEGSRLLGRSEASNDPALFARVQWSVNQLRLGADAGRQANNAVTGEDVVALTAYANYKLADWKFLGEYFVADMDAVGDFKGYALRASYRIKKFEPVFRYAYLETDSFVIDLPELIRRAPEPGSAFDTIPAGDNELTSFYFGLNYHHNRAVKFMSGYEIAEGEADNGDNYNVDGFRARVQLLW